MELRNQFESVVSIGRFNPAILTPDFLFEHCGFKSDEKPVGSSTPVISEIVFGTIHFFMELSKFQILEKNINDFNRRNLVELVLNYLNILQYTPISLLGINYNFDLHDVNLRKIEHTFSSLGEIEKLIGRNIMNMTSERYRTNNSHMSLKGVEISSEFCVDFKNTVKVIIFNDHVNINNNYELSDLHENRNKIELLKIKYEELLADNDRIIKLMGDT